MDQPPARPARAARLAAEGLQAEERSVCVRAALQQEAAGGRVPDCWIGTGSAQLASVLLALVEREAAAVRVPRAVAQDWRR